MRPPGDHRDWFSVAVVGQVITAFIIFGAGVGEAPLSFDETASVTAAGRGFKEIWDLLGNTDANMGLYYLLLHPWLLVSDSETWVRLPSILAGVATVPVTSVLGRRLFGAVAGALAGFLMLGNMFVVTTAETARAYPLAILVITISSLMFVQAVVRTGTGHHVAYAVTSVLAVYLSPLAGLVVIAQALSLVFLAPGARLRRSFALVYGWIALAVTPLLLMMWWVGAGQVGWITQPGLEQLGSTAEELAGGYRPLAIGLCLAILVAFVSLVRTARGSPVGRWKAAFVVGWMLLPLMLLYVYSQWQPLFASRYLATSTPALSILAGLGIATLIRWRPALGIGFLAIVASLALMFVIQSKTNYELCSVCPWREEASDRAAAKRVSSQSRDGDGILYAAGWRRMSFDWKLRRSLSPGSHVPDDFAVAQTAEEIDTLWANYREPTDIARRVPDHLRVWILEWPEDPHDWPYTAVLPILKRTHTLSRSDIFPSGLTLRLYSHK